jgi:hypothetical protein
MKKPVRITKQQLDTIEKLYLEGVNPYRIAKQMGIAPAVARYHTKPLKKAVQIEPTILDAYSEFKEEIKKLKTQNRLLTQLFSMSLENQL